MIILHTMETDQYFNINTPLRAAIRYRHDKCSAGKSKALIVTRFPDHWKYNCHRCGWKGIRPIKDLTPDQVIALSAEKPKINVSDQGLQLPADFTQKLPNAGLLWLYSYFIKDSEFEKYSIGYSHYYNRVVLPVYDKGDLVYWQGRYLGTPDKDNPKYINIFGRDRKDVYFEVINYDHQQVILVEDILSAIRIGRQCNCIALLGSYIPDDLLLELPNKYSNIIIWLDNDKLKQAIRYYMRCNMLNISSSLIDTPLDPKCYADKEIYFFINNCISALDK